MESQEATNGVSQASHSFDEPECDAEFFWWLHVSFIWWWKQRDELGWIVYEDYDHDELLRIIVFTGWNSPAVQFFIGSSCNNRMHHPVSLIIEPSLSHHESFLSHGCDLVGGLEHVLFSTYMIYIYIYHILGMSSSQLTNSYFSQGGSTTSDGFW